MITTKPGFREILTAEGAADQFLRKVKAEKKSLSQLLEDADPTDEYPVGDPLRELDAYERQLHAYDIRLEADLKTMRPASKLEQFVDPVRETGSDQGKRFFASDQPQSWVLYPEYINRQMRIIPLPEDVLGEIVSIVTPTDSDLYKTIYLNDNIQTAPGQAQRQLVRVDQGAEIPAITIKTFENGVKLNKYGLALKGSYETYRRLRVDLFTLFLARIAMQIKLDLATFALNVIQNGDGNANAAPNYNVSTLDPQAGAGPGVVTDLVTSQTSTISKNLTYLAWLKFRASLYPLKLTTVVGRLNEILQVLVLQMPNIDPLALLALLQQGNQAARSGMGAAGGDAGASGGLSIAVPIFGTMTRLVYHPWAPGGVLVGLDKRFAVEQLIEANSSLTETDKDIRTQLNEIVISQVVGFDKFLVLASSTLTFV